MDYAPMAPQSTSSREAVINIRAQHRQRELIDRAAEDVLLDQRLIQLGPEAWERFNALLDAPAKDNPALRALLASKPVWEA